MTTGPVQPGLPMHIARAYRLTPTQPVAAPQSPEPSGREASARSGRLSAAEVPGRVTFDVSVGASAEGSLPMYTNPALRNAAATGVRVGSPAQLGRVLDAEA